MFGDKTGKLRALQVGETITWPYSMRNTVYKLAENIGVCVTVRKRGEMMDITRISVTDKPRLVKCECCGHVKRLPADEAYRVLRARREIEDI